MNNKILKELDFIFEDNINMKNNYKPLEEVIYNTILKKIILHEYKPGQRIVDKNLAEELDVSRSLIRQIFKILEKDELIFSRPRSGYYVKKMNKKDIADIYNLRSLLESYSVELAMPFIKDEDIDEIEEIIKVAKKDLKKKETLNTIKVDIYLHKIFINNCNNKYLRDMIYRFNSQINYYRIYSFYQLNLAINSFNEHYDIFQALKSRNSNLTIKMMKKHIKSAKKIILEKYDQFDM